MGRKSMAEQNGLVELIVEHWEGGRNTIVYVTEEVNRKLQEMGLRVVFSRESIRRVIKSHQEEVEDAKRAMESAKAMAAVFKDNPGTEISEAALMHLSSLIAKELRSIDSITFESPAELCRAMSQIATSQERLSNYRTKAVKSLDKAKAQLKAELQNEIQSDPELLARLLSILDKVEM